MNKIWSTLPFAIETRKGKAILDPRTSFDASSVHLSRSPPQIGRVRKRGIGLWQVGPASNSA
jgi:hypothetical protein